MLAQNILAILALSLAVSALPTNDPPSYCSPEGVTSEVVSASAPVSTRIPTSSDRDHPTASSTASAVPSPSRVSSGNDGQGNQGVGNSGQNTGNSAADSGNIRGDYTVEQATTTCGNSQLNCCNYISEKGDTTNFGLLASIFGDGVGFVCSPLSIPIIGGMIPLTC